MSRDRRSERERDRLGERLERLSAISDLTAAGEGRLPADLRERVDATVEHARVRLGHGTTHTVVALAGATGSGKSSMFNALVGAQVAQVGVRRPTTSSAQAAVFDPTGTLGESVAGLLDWLEVGRRNVVDRAHVGDLAGLVLLDLPDHDSTSTEHRAEVDRLVDVVDAFIWVVDPQKYADLALHDQYLRRFAGHAAVTIVVLNQIDLVPERERRAVLDDLGSLLREDGLREVRVVAASTATGEGVPELTREVVARVTERRAALARLDADVDWIGEQLLPEVGDRDPVPIARASREQLVRSFAGASGADAVADAVADAHRHRAGQVLGWPPTRWLTRLRPDPLRRLGLDRGAGRDASEDAAPVARTSRAAPSAVAEAAVATAIRSLADDASAGLPDRWQQRVAEVSVGRRDDVADALDRAVGSSDLPTDRPAWWSAVSALQWVLAGLMVVGLLWLVVIGVVAWLKLPDLPTPRIGAIPWPTLLLVGGAASGLIVSVVARACAGVGARRRARAARRTLDRAAAGTADELVVAPVDAELSALAELRTHALALHG